MSESEKLAEVQHARRRFDDAIRGMERFIMNLDPGRAQGLRDWLRTVDADGRPDRLSPPSLEGLPLAEQVSGHLETVLAARTAWRKAWKHLHPGRRKEAAPPAEAH